MSLFDVPQEVRDTDDWSTPPDIFHGLDRIHHFTLDVAAAEHNAKCDRYFDINDDGLSNSWNGQRVWCNPPYSDIKPWVAKAWEEHPKCPVIVMLIPANRTEQAWWQDLVEPHRDKPDTPLTVTFLRGRIRFLMPGARRSNAGASPLFGSCTLTWKAAI